MYTYYKMNSSYNGLLAVHHASVETFYWKRMYTDTMMSRDDNAKTKNVFKNIIIVTTRLKTNRFSYRRYIVEMTNELIHVMYDKLLLF